jgi:hypothetical protein
MNAREALLSVKEVVERFGDSRAVRNYYLEFGWRFGFLSLLRSTVGRVQILGEDRFKEAYKAENLGALNILHSKDLTRHKISNDDRRRGTRGPVVYLRDCNEWIVVEST